MKNSNENDYDMKYCYINKRGGTRWTEARLTSLATGSNLKDSTSSQHHSNEFHEDDGLVALGNPQWMPCQGS